MKRDPGGTLTAICMLIPMIAVPWFAIRGTQDLPSIQSQPEDAESELSYTDFETSNDSLADAPPFPSGDSTVLADNDSLDDGFDWDRPDPFDASTFDPSPADSQPASPPPARRNEPADPGAAFGEPASGLGSADVWPGEPRELSEADSLGSPTNAPPRRDPNVRPVGVNPERPAANDVTARWKLMISQLERAGMRNYRVETTEDRSVYFVTAFFQHGPTLQRIEGQGKHPLTALQSVVTQFRESRSNQ